MTKNIARSYIKSIYSNSIPVNVNIGDSGNEPVNEDRISRLIKNLRVGRNNIQTFDGLVKISVSSWIEQFAYLEDEWSDAKLLAFVRPFVKGKAKKWMTAMEGIEFNDYASFKCALVEEFTEEEAANRNEVKEFYRLLLDGPKNGELEEFILDLIIQNKKANVEFAVIRGEIEKLFPSLLREKVSLAENWNEIRSIIKRNSSLLKRPVSQSLKMTSHNMDQIRSTKQDELIGLECDHCGLKHPGTCILQWHRLHETEQAKQLTSKKLKKSPKLITTNDKNHLIRGEDVCGFAIEKRTKSLVLHEAFPRSKYLIFERDFSQQFKDPIELNSGQGKSNGELTNSLSRLLDFEGHYPKKVGIEMPDQPMEHLLFVPSSSSLKREESSYERRLTERGEYLNYSFGFRQIIHFLPNILIANGRNYHIEPNRKFCKMPFDLFSVLMHFYSLLFQLKILSEWWRYKFKRFSLCYPKFYGFSKRLSRVLQTSLNFPIDLRLRLFKTLKSVEEKFCFKRQREVWPLRIFI